jgi:formate dehydrogenase major subunit
MATVTIDSKVHQLAPGEPLIDIINRAGEKIPQVCYHPQLGPIQTCDACMVEVDGQLVRACATAASDGMAVLTASPGAATAQRQAFDRILGNHMLYCTVCDNNNGNCTVHNTTALLAIEHQETPFTLPSRTKDFSNPFYRYDPDQCILCGRCVEACQNRGSERDPQHPLGGRAPARSLGWRSPIGESSCVSCGHCVTVCPCNALMENSMLGHAGFLTSLPEAALEGMIDVVKEIEPETGYGSVLALSEAESAMRESRIRRTKTVCTYCGVGCSFDIWTKDRHILKVEPRRAGERHLDVHQRQVRLGFANSEDRLTKPLIRENGNFAKPPGTRRSRWWRADSLRSKQPAGQTRSPSSLRRNAPTKKVT